MYDFSYVYIISTNFWNKNGENLSCHMSWFFIYLLHNLKILWKLRCFPKTRSQMNKNWPSYGRFWYHWKKFTIFSKINMLFENFRYPANFEAMCLRICFKFVLDWAQIGWQLIDPGVLFAQAMCYVVQSMWRVGWPPPLC